MDGYVYLIRIYDRPFGFRMVAVVSASERLAKATCMDRYRCQFDDRVGGMFAEVQDLCPINYGCMATSTFEE